MWLLYTLWSTQGHLPRSWKSLEQSGAKRGALYLCTELHSITSPMSDDHEGEPRHCKMRFNSISIFANRHPQPRSSTWWASSSTFIQSCICERTAGTGYAIVHTMAVEWEQSTMGCHLSECCFGTTLVLLIWSWGRVEGSRGPIRRSSSALHLMA